AVSWYRSGNTTSDGPAIPGASGTQYTLSSEDVGQYITAKVYAVSYDTVVGNNAKVKTGQIQPAEQPFPQGTTLALLLTQVSRLSVLARRNSRYRLGA
ncbi:hypothetical protein, partial [Enterobacter mori]|uniref:hypothetical protein n=1 Tax=Enterobacter mori TaxID=539813 RepID=UPI0022361304